MYRIFNADRIGQITGATGQTWKHLTDPVGNPLLTDTGRFWNAIGIDLGANAEHSDGRLYFFTGDVATDRSGNPPDNSDMVAWTAEPEVLRNGGHLLTDSWDFQLPRSGPNVHGQPGWQFCMRCCALFYTLGAPAACSLGGNHDTYGLSWDLSVPVEPATEGQNQWRFCTKCHPAVLQRRPHQRLRGRRRSRRPGQLGVRPACAAGIPRRAVGLALLRQLPLPVLQRMADQGHLQRRARRRHPPQRGDRPGHPQRPLRPFPRRPADGLPRLQRDPRRRVQLRRPHVRLRRRRPARADHAPPGRVTRSRATTCSAKPTRPKAGQWDIEFLLAPKLGWCVDVGRLEPHAPLGLHFLAVRNIGEQPHRRNGFRMCHKCEALFYAGGPTNGVCAYDGLPHQPDDALGDFSLEINPAEDAHDQTNWKMCQHCA